MDHSEAFRAAKVSAEAITGDMPARARADLIARFDRGEVQVLTNCMVLTEGFDSQHVGCIGILRPMLHKGTFIQAVGRGLRRVDPKRFPGIVKTDCIVLDFAGAALRHGTLEQEIDLRRGRDPARRAPVEDLPVLRGRTVAWRLHLRSLRSRLQPRDRQETPADRLRDDRDRSSGSLPLFLVRSAWRQPGADGQRLPGLGRRIPRRHAMARARPAQGAGDPPPLRSARGCRRWRRPTISCA
ncbi:hypothetical protein K3552_13915 [Leisingera aquaemixtae]|uniref:DEAD/DEAH box helicase n=1 Tax=Leisingera aquaemixtae TaxID=1396826 RepID=UPI00220BBC3D|nr:hypothetical protein K3552_13915 [Leisingera aquaemixtae]